MLTLSFAGKAVMADGEQITVKNVTKTVVTVENTTTVTQVSKVPESVTSNHIYIGEIEPTLDDKELTSVTVTMTATKANIACSTEDKSDTAGHIDSSTYDGLYGKDNQAAITQILKTTTDLASNDITDKVKGVAGGKTLYLYAWVNENTSEVTVTATYEETPDFEEETYNITYETNGGKINNTGYVQTYISGKVTALPTNVTKTDYTFGGWYADANFSGERIIVIDAAETGDKKFYAKWDDEKKVPAQIDTTAYLFVHFKGNGRGQEQIYFAVSEDGKKWENLNDNEPVLTSTLGEKGVRDPHIIRSPEGDKFFLIATDLRISETTWDASQKNGSRKIMIWESTDLVNWSEQREATVAVDDAGCTWAPESIFDYEKNLYMVFWSSRVSSDSYAKQRIYRSYTTDFVNFTPAELYEEDEMSLIDMTFIREGDTYYRFMKNEDARTIIMEQSKTLEGPFEPVSTYKINGNDGTTQSGYEGPTIYKMNGEDKWCMLLDNYSNGGYKPFETEDISTGEFVSASNFELPDEFRHGTVIPITTEEYAALKTEYKNTEIDPIVDLGGIDLNDYKAAEFASGSIGVTSNAYDGNLSTSWDVNRDGKYYVGYQVFDAGEGKVFDLKKIKMIAQDKNSRLMYMGTNNDDILKSPEVMNPAEEDLCGADSVAYQEFAKLYNANILGSTSSALNSSNKMYEAENALSGKYRYLIVASNTWSASSISEIAVYAEVKDKQPYEAEITMAANEKTAVANYSVLYNETDKTFDAYLAVYNMDGTLSAVKADKLSSGTKTISFTVSDDEKYICKAFLWDDMEPVCDSVEKYLNDTTGFADTSIVTLAENSVFSESEKTGLNYIKSIDVDRLLAPSFEVHNLSAPNNAQRYGGWERKGANNWSSSSDTFTLAGHSLGHWMSAAAAFYRDTGDTEILEKLNYAVDKLDELQKNTNSPYIGGCVEEAFAGAFENGYINNKQYWVPWYGIHKIYQGLIDAYICTENKTAFTVLKKFADWAVDGTANLTDAQMQSMLNLEYGGMNEIFALMYEFTGEDKYLAAARRFTHDSILNPLISGNDVLAGLHANTQIPKIVGAAEIYEQSPTEYPQYKTACENFWNFVVNDRSYAIGGNSISEHFEGKGAESLGVKTCESCNTYNMMRLTEHLFSWQHDSKYMDYYEDALYNHILGQQDPDTGSKMYFVSMLQGHHRVYEVKDEAWWCCTGTGMENPGRYTRCIYFEDNDNLYVNLYMPNTYTWKEKGLEFKVETNYPYSQNVKMTVLSGNSNAAINFRAPSWLESKMMADVAGNEYSAEGGSYLTINREWNAGDVINITIPMNVRTYYSRQDNKIAYKYGPVALAAPLGSVENVNGVDEYISNETRIDTITADVPYIITNDAKPEELVELADESTLTFTIKGENNSSGENITLVPFYGVHHQFYTVYWNVNEEADPFEKALNDVTIDKVEPDGQQDEIGHNKQTNTSGSTHQGSFTGNGKTYMYRDAWGEVDTGSNELPYFSYDLSVAEGQNYLYSAYWGSDGPFRGYTRDFNIYVDGTLIGEQTIDNNSPNNVYSVFYKIPQNLTEGKETVTVKLQAKTETGCACTIELRTTKATVE